jgi:uncharacterized membrane protein
MLSQGKISANALRRCRTGAERPLETNARRSDDLGTNGEVMVTLTALKFPTADGAQETADVLTDLSERKLITIVDAAVVTWPLGEKKPKTRQLHSLAGLGALDGAFWGLLFGLIFFVPLLGLGIGAAMGAVAASLADTGIDDEFIQQVRRGAREGTSSLFLMAEDVIRDRILDELRARHLYVEVVATNLPKDKEAELRALFAA